ncbi:MAG: cell wall-binding repeat-containing protein, partial [Mogibacterium sp.]|nr:cell wall-binding repeat-containing protein [Mogibacterium sp.]
IVVACGTDFPDALSGGYLAYVKNAPLLLVDNSSEATITQYIKDNLKAGGKVYILGGTGVVSTKFENGLVALYTGNNVIRLGGSNRYDTNLRILKEAGISSEEILVCCGSDFADSLSASAAKRPILLVDSSLRADQKTFLQGLTPGKLYIIGGTGAVSDSIKSQLKSATGLEAKRLSGINRYQTSVAVAKEFFSKDSTKTVVFALGSNFPDGLSGSVLAIENGAPLILTDNAASLRSIAKDYVSNYTSAGDSITLGGPTLITPETVKYIMSR